MGCVPLQLFEQTSAAAYASTATRQYWSCSTDSPVNPPCFGLGGARKWSLHFPTYPPLGFRRGFMHVPKICFQYPAPHEMEAQMADMFNACLLWAWTTSLSLSLSRSGLAKASGHNAATRFFAAVARDSWLFRRPILGGDLEQAISGCSGFASKSGDLRSRHRLVELGIREALPGHGQQI